VMTDTPTPPRRPRAPRAGANLSEPQEAAVDQAVQAHRDAEDHIAAAEAARERLRRRVVEAVDGQDVAVAALARALDLHRTNVHRLLIEGRERIEEDRQT
jgi:DNA-directed RNA polymerase specialized sigma24 family protein